MSSDEGNPGRSYPALDERHAAGRPVSFVCVRFSEEIEHNLMQSECVRDPANQLVLVDNRHNLAFDTLGQAIEHGLAQARHELVVVVHEDVLLRSGWQPALERALVALDGHDPDWAFAGVAGWRDGNTMVGHWSDPHGYYDLLDGAPFAEVDRFDEQLIVLRRSGRVPFDPRLPSIHNIGRDLVRQARLRGRRSYVVDAPTIHKYADAGGRRILRAGDSPKIGARASLTYRADRECSDRYLKRKWADASVQEPSQARSEPGLSPPIVLLAKGGGGSRLLSVLAEDAGIDLGKRLNASGDALDLVPALYGLVLAKHRYGPAGLAGSFIADLRVACGARKPLADPWGFKLPETLLVLDEVLEAFPGARFVHMVRDPLATCMRRSHQTARYDNQVGQAALLAAYRDLGLETGRIADEDEAVRMAITTVHQLGSTLDWTARLPPERLLELRFEDLLSDPGRELQRLRSWLGPAAGASSGPARDARIFSVIDDARARPRTLGDASATQRVMSIIAPLRNRLGYR